MRGLFSCCSSNDDELGGHLTAASPLTSSTYAMGPTELVEDTTCSEDSIYVVLNDSTRPVMLETERFFPTKVDSSGPCVILDMPLEVLIEVSKFLSIRSIQSLRKSSKKLAAMFDDDFWHGVALSRWEAFESLKEEKETWEQYALTQTSDVGSYRIRRFVVKMRKGASPLIVFGDNSRHQLILASQPFIGQPTMVPFSYFEDTSGLFRSVACGSFFSVFLSGTDYHPVLCCRAAVRVCACGPAPLCLCSRYE